MKSTSVQVCNSLSVLAVVLVSCGAIAHGADIELPKSGQLSCWDEAGAVIDCTGTGQDGEHRAGVAWPIARFTNHGDGTITDDLTGLMWLKDAGCLGQGGWDTALSTVADFNANPGGYSCAGYSAAYTDWRLPNIHEYASLYNFEIAAGNSWLEAQGFSNVPATGYNSATGMPENGSTKITAYMAALQISNGSAVGTSRIWAVRAGANGAADPSYPANVWKSGQDTCWGIDDQVMDCTGTGRDGELQWGVSHPSPRFTDNGDGTITDELTGLMWLKQVDCLDRGKWQTALDSVAAFNIAAGSYGCSDYSASHTDWRLPNAVELRSLMDFNELDPAVAPELAAAFENFPAETSYESLWSSTTSVYRGGDEAYQFFPFDATLSTRDKDNNSMGYLAWAVRGGQTGSVASANLGVTLAEDADPVNAGTALGYTVVLSSAGPDPAAGSWLRLTISPEVALSAATPSVGSCSLSGATALCDLGTVLSAGVVTVTVAATAPIVSGAVQAEVEVGSGALDGDSTNDTARVDTMVVAPVNLAKTGQTTDLGSQYGEDDGALQMGARWPNTRFRILYADDFRLCADQTSDCDGDPTTDVVEDLRTGLMWVRTGFIGEVFNPSWAYPLDHVQNFINDGSGFAGFHDWRVPNLREMLSLYNPGPQYLMEWLGAQGFVFVRGVKYWTSTTSTENPDEAWTVKFDGLTPAIAMPKSSFSDRGFWPVRGRTRRPAQLVPTGQTLCYDPTGTVIACSSTVNPGQDGAHQSGVPWPSPRFTDPDGSTPVTGTVVKDQLTGLMWTRNAYLAGSDATWAEALQWVQSDLVDTTYGSYDDWRLPNLLELHSLVDYSGTAPALPTGHPFSNVQNRYWSSTTEAGYDRMSVVMAGTGAGAISNAGVSSPLAVWGVRGDPDHDADGVDLSDDNCPGMSNFLQSDVDSDGDGDVCDPCPADADDACVWGGAAAAEVLAASGGIIFSSDGVLALEIEVGDLGANATISATREVAADEVDLVFASQSGLGEPLAVYELEPDGISFTGPITVTVSLDVSALSAGQRDDLALYRLDGGGIYQELAGSSCTVTEDPDDVYTAVCSASISSFSNYALVAPLDSDGDGVPDQFGGVEDNCPYTANPEQTDSDGDGIGDVCEPPQWSLSVSLAGGGTGSVSSDPAGIVCGGDCSQSFDEGTTVTLTASPHPSSLFAAWSGDADCGDGVVTMDSDLSCTATFDLRAALLLVDDDDNNPDVRSSYTAALDSLGVDYDLWDTANSDLEPDATVLAYYGVVLWFSGAEVGGFAGPGSAGEAALASYLDSGGCFLLSSQDYLYDRGGVTHDQPTSFMSAYLGLASCQSDVGQATLNGASPWFTDLGPFSLSYPFADAADLLSPTASARLAFSGPGGDAGISREHAGSRTVYVGTPIEALPTAGDVESVLGELFDFCDGVFADGFESGDDSLW
jgi:hypothetical protein